MTTRTPKGRSVKAFGVAGILLATLAGCGDSGPSTLDPDEIVAAVNDALEDVGIEDAEIDCPENRRIREGDDFECDVEADGLEFEVVVTQTDDEGELEVAAPNVLVQEDVEAAVAEGLAEELDDELTAECEGFDDGRAVLAAGADFTCAITGASGLTAVAAVTVDPDEDAGVTFEIEGDPVIPTTTTSTTTTTTSTTTTTTVPATLPPTLPPVTLPPNTDDTVDTVDTTDTSTPGTGPDSESIFFDGFGDNANGWLEQADDPSGLSLTVGETYSWIVGGVDVSPLPFVVVADATPGGLTDIDVLVDLVAAGGMAGVTCMSNTVGGYAFTIGADRAYIGKYTFDAGVVELVSGPFTPNPEEADELVASCFPIDGGVRLILTVNGEELLEVDDTTDPFLEGTAGLIGDIDVTKPQDSVFAFFSFDNFEILQFG